MKDDVPAGPEAGENLASREERSVYVSSGAFRAEDVTDLLRQVRGMGLDAIELSSGLPYRPDTLDRVAEHRGSFRFLAHNYFPAPADPFVLNLAAADTAILERSRAHCRRALDLTAGFGAPFYAAHAGFMVQPRVDELGRPFGEAPLTPRDRAWDLFLESVRELLDHARRLGVRFLVENNVVAPFNAPNGRNDRFLLADPDEMLAFSRAVDDPDFVYLMDVGHLKVSARTLGFDPAAAMTALVPLIGAFHCSDNDGTADTNRSFTADAWFLPWLRTCAAAEVVIEVAPVGNAELHGCLDAARSWMTPAL